MPIDKIPNGSNIINFPKKNNGIINVKGKTTSNISTIINEQKYSLKKQDIIASLIMGDGNISDPDTAIDLMREDYFDLYTELVIMICENAGKFYHLQGFDLLYDKNNLGIFLISKNNDFHPIPLDINLLPKEDFSDITIELSYQGNIMFQANCQGAGKTNFIPHGINDNILQDEEYYMEGLSEKEIILIKNNKSKSGDLISAITTNFSEYIVSNNDIIDNLEYYSRLYLIDLLTEMIVDNYGSQYKLSIDPFSPLLIQQKRKKGNREWLEDIHFELKINKDTYNTSIKLYNSKGVRILEIQKI